MRAGFAAGLFLEAISGSSIRPRYCNTVCRRAYRSEVLFIAVESNGWWQYNDSGFSHRRIMAVETTVAEPSAERHSRDGPRIYFNGKCVPCHNIYVGMGQVSVLYSSFYVLFFTSFKSVFRPLSNGAVVYYSTTTPTEDWRTCDNRSYLVCKYSFDVFTLRQITIHNQQYAMRIVWTGILSNRWIFYGG